MTCHQCGHHHGTAVDKAPATPRMPFVTIDMHCHLLAPAAEAMVAAHPSRKAELDVQARSQGAASMQHNASMREAIGGRLTNVAQRIEDMDRLGIDVQVLSPSPTQYFHWAGEALAAQIAQAQNDAIEAACKHSPERFIGLAAVSLQHPALAARQLRDAVERRGFKGAQISSDPTGRGLDDPALEVFWQEAEALGNVVFLHPLGTSLGERVNRYYLSNILGQPLETTVALSELIFGGVLDRFPRLKICAAHGGGYLPNAIGRSDHGFGVRPEAAGCAGAPSHYLRRIWYDTVVFRADALRNLIEVAGLGQIVAGTDYPFDMGEYDLHALLRELADSGSSDAAENILGLNAQRLLGIDASHPAIVAARLTLGIR
ncbi:amidohydrolase family protein [soil metagenome]